MGFLKKKTPDTPRRRASPEREVRQVSSADRQQTFQRNRTLTGSVSNSLSNTHHRTDMESPRTKAHHLAMRRRKIGGILLVVVAIATIIFGLLMQFTARVSVAVSDPSISSVIDQTAYDNAINDYLSANPLERLRFALNQGRLSDYLMQKLPEVDGLSGVQFAKIGETNFILTMRRPVAGWTIGNKQYYVDAKGIAFEHNYYANPGVEIVDQSGVGVQDGLAIASNRFLGFVGKVVAQSKTSGYMVQQAIIPQDTTRELEVKLQNVVPLVKLSVDRPVGDQVEDMSRALHYLASHGINPSYIDVRVSGKAFYM